MRTMDRVHTEVPDWISEIRRGSGELGKSRQAPAIVPGFSR